MDHDIRSIYKIYRKNGGKLDRLTFSRIVCSWGKEIGEYISTTGNIFELPYLGRIGFEQVSAEDFYIERRSIPVDYSEKYKYWASQTELTFNEIDNSSFYTNKPVVRAVWKLYKRLGLEKNVRLKAYDISFSRKISRKLKENFNNGMYLPTMR